LQSTHQLKAPFAAIQSYTDIILQGFTGDIPQLTREIVQKINRRSQLLADSIKEMLNLANLKSCVKDNLKMEDIDVRELLQKIIHEATVLAEKNQITLNYSEENLVSLVNYNRAQLEILFSILIDNAINYSFAGKSVEVSVKQINNLITISIRDEGIGIRPQHREKIFNEYFRSNEAVEKHENGSGLGLAIVKQITSIHNIGLQMQSAPQQGTIFTVILNTPTLQ